MPLESAKLHLENVWNSVNLLNLASDIMESDRYMSLYKRAERSYLSRFSSRSIYNCLLKIKAVSLDGRVLCALLLPESDFVKKKLALVANRGSQPNLLVCFKLEIYFRKGFLVT